MELHLRQPGGMTSRLLSYMAKNRIGASSPNWDRDLMYSYGETRGKGNEQSMGCMWETGRNCFFHIQQGEGPTAKLPLLDLVRCFL